MTAGLKDHLLTEGLYLLSFWPMFNTLYMDTCYGSDSAALLCPPHPHLPLHLRCGGAGAVTGVSTGGTWAAPLCRAGNTRTATTAAAAVAVAAKTG